MANFFMLELDTTGPSVSISAPYYTLPNTETEILINSSKNVAPDYQDIYIMDSLNVRHDVIFAQKGDSSFIGRLYFSDYHIGIAQIFAQIRDDVFNLSNLAIAAIDIRRGAKVDIEAKDSVRSLELSEETRQLITAEETRSINTIEILRDIDLQANTQTIEVTEDG